ncbi:thiamine phosphate synthase [Pedobacter nototheniae]|uniref:thiamine phosphate synthase n=1 Tax=Pedobacter nototheniae TaxID=2488994 RepID=UPI00293185D5|nr:thiamine phosphate synthase [Pedobacter nototheniae]
MLVVISNPVQIEEEARYINGLFKAGLQFFHLRKPGCSIKETEYLLDCIDREHHSKIALHQHHQISDKRGIKRLHFTEHLRKETNPKMLSRYADEGFILSTSIHHMEAYNTLHHSFSYCFIGPLFNSISKINYQANSKLMRIVQKETSNNPKRIAIGGIDGSKITEVKALGYGGAAILGAIWSKPAQSVSTFKKIQDLWI